MRDVDRLAKQKGKTVQLWHWSPTGRMIDCRPVGEIVELERISDWSGEPVGRRARPVGKSSHTGRAQTGSLL